MWPSLDQKAKRYRELERLMADTANASDPNKLTALNREYGSLEKHVRPFFEFMELHDQKTQAEAMLVDPDMAEMAAEEVERVRPRMDELKSKIEERLLDDPEDEFDRLILEIRAGVGGDEAAIFAGDLYRMYTAFARDQGWQVEELEISPGEAGGFKEIVLGIHGDGAFRHLRFESGGHRVQRVPKTETQGRIHTSLATVAVLPEPSQVDVEVKDEDIEWERMRAGGAGGQHVNKTESAVRIWYKKGTPDQIEVKCQDERSQGRNYESAMRILRSRVYERQQAKLHAERSEARRTLVGTGDRSERIRTYNFPQNRVTDHRVGATIYSLDAVMAGKFELVLAPVLEFDRQQKLTAIR